jgi:hypothetical protein
MKRAITTLTFVLFILLSFTAKSQSVYEIKFKDAKQIQYSCLLVFFHENNAYMRIAYKYQNTEILVNVTYRMKNGVNYQGVRYSMLSGYFPVLIKGYSSDRKYNPDFFVWFFNSITQKYDPPVTTDDTLLRYQNYRPVDTYMQLSPGTVTEPQLLKYFLFTDPNYVALKKTFGLTPVTIKPIVFSKPTTLHFILIANTLDPSIGIGVSVDKTNLRNEFRQIAGALGVSYREYIIDDIAFSKERLMSTLNSVIPASNDIVVFIYRGHGFRWRTQTDDWPRMDLHSYGATSSENNSMNLSEVHSILKSKKARLNIVLGDLCNSLVPETPVTLNPYLTFQMDNNSDISRLKRLFLNSSGMILSAAAQKYEFSYCSPSGGVYTISFLQALRDEISYSNKGVSNWDNLLLKTISLSRTKTTPTMCPTCKIQNGIKNVSVFTY